MADVIIKFKKSAVAKSSTDFVTGLGGEIKHVYSGINAVSASVPNNKIKTLKADPDIEYIELDNEANILGFPDDMLQEEKSAVLAGQTVPWGIVKIRAQEVWALGNRGAGIRGCIIDTGIDYNHPDLKDNYKGGYNTITKTNDPLDDNGHGSHVAGIAAARDNDIGVIGVAPEMDIYAVKALDANGSGTYSNIIAGIQWAIDNKMHLINMSLGGSTYSKALEDICVAAYNAGILIVAAAGNQGGDGSKDTVSYPAKLESVVAVAATDQNDQRASFSSAGPEVEVAAPGVSILSTVPTSKAKYSDPSGYKSLSGTSMACPHTFGCAAVVMKSNPHLANADVRKILSSTSVDIAPPGKDIFFGSGRIDAKAAVDNNPPAPPVLAKITVTPVTVSVVIGNELQFKATALDQNNNPMAGIEISWTEDNKNAGNVNPPSAVTKPDGTAVTTFTAVAVGTATVTASSGNVSGSASVIVTETPQPPVLTTIEVTPATASLIAGNKQEFKATAFDQNNNPMAGIGIAWVVDNTNAGIVYPLSAVTGPEGTAVTTFTALAEGTAAVTASSGNVSGSAKATVSAAPPPKRNITVHAIGLKNSPSGILVLRRTKGDLTADEACKKVCEILKSL